MADCKGEVVVVVAGRDAHGKPTQVDFESSCGNPGPLCHLGLGPGGTARRRERVDVQNGDLGPLVAQKPGRTKRLRAECQRRQQAPNN